MTANRKVFIALVLATTVLSSSPSSAWDAQGHMATGAIAYDALVRSNPRAVIAILEIMREHPDHARFDLELASLSGAARDRELFEYMARWPDDVRLGPFDHPDWHYNVKVVSPWRFVMPFTFGKAVQVFSAELAVARDTKAPMAQRAIALCWIMHIVGDMHQPLHAGHWMSWRFPATDRAGTIGWIRSARGAAPMTLHEFWDNSADLPGPEVRAADLLAAKVETAHPYPSHPLHDQTPQQAFDTWVAQSRRLAADIAYKGTALDETRSPADAPVLSTKYVAQARTIAEARIAQAGYEIADLLASVQAK